MPEIDLTSYLKDDLNDIANLLFIFTVLTNAQTVVELGTGWQGITTGIFLEALKITGGKLFTVDIEECKQVRERYKDNLQVEFAQVDSVEYAKTWAQGNIDLLFCDTNHSFEKQYDELRAWSKFNPKLILIHDTLFGGHYLPDHQVGELRAPWYAMKKFCEEQNKPFININSLPLGLGVILYRTR